jgi:hypothetical protein
LRKELLLLIHTQASALAPDLIEQAGIMLYESLDEGNERRAVHVGNQIVHFHRFLYGDILLLGTQQNGHDVLAPAALVIGTRTLDPLDLIRVELDRDNVRVYIAALYLGFQRVLVRSFHGADLAVGKVLLAALK